MVSLTAIGVGVKAVSVFVQRSVSTVRRWFSRNETTAELRDLQRSGRPPLYSEKTKLGMIAFYCQTTPLSGVGRWSFRWATQYLEAEPAILDASPSKSTLHRTLKGHRLKPHQSRYFLNITDPDFFPKMEPLTALYENPPRQLFFFDECPGIQVLSRLVPDMQTDTMKQRLEEFEYIRNGTLDVFAFLNHADGKVALECHADHTTETFLGAFQRHAERQPAAEPIHYVMDNLSSHRSYPFCQLVAKLSQVRCPPEKELSTQVKRAEWLQGDDKRIVIHFTPFHGSWLNLVEIWFGIMGCKVLTESFGSPDELKDALETFQDSWNLLLAHPFRWTYDGDGLHEKAVQRFTAMLQSSAAKINLRTLTKLLMLMTNLLQDYFKKISSKTWDHLVRALSSQFETISDIIHNEPGPIRKKKAELAAQNILITLEKRGLQLEYLTE